MYRLIIALILTCVGLSVFASYKISQDSCSVKDNESYQFVVWKTGKYCYAKPHVPKTLKVWGVFDTLEECEEHLSLRE